MSKYYLSNLKKDGGSIAHTKNQTKLIMDLPPVYEGKSRSFSSMDLLSASVGFCCLSTIENYSG